MWTETQQPPPSVTQEHWSMYLDGPSTLNGVGGGIILISPKGDWLVYVIQLHFHATNNVAKYQALVNGLHIAAKLGVQRLYIYGDSDLIINQVM
jgi:ribonuclease HI